MIHFPPLRTKRLDVKLRELRLREAVELAAIPPHLFERATTALLACVVQDMSEATPAIDAWTIQERTMAVAHYLAHATDGEPNFAVGEGAFLDYLDAHRDEAPGEIEAGRACGDDWVMSQLTGAQAEAMESFCRSRLDWLTADMAARLHVRGKETPPATADLVAYTEWLSERASVFRDFPESDFEELYALYATGLPRLHHLFALDFDDMGHVLLPAAAKEGGAALLAPARFRAASCVGRIAQALSFRAA
jgi:hypothetical protein